jgi:LysR family transcriptional regulator, glycine cleavage system transcriptional activator
MMRLPPLSDLVAFEAAARHRTFTVAAQELNVTQPAISRRIALLERDLGCKLFSRECKPFKLTPVGQNLFEALRSGLSRIESAVAEIRNSGLEKTITIRISSGLAFFWLTPRLPRLQAAFPDYRLRILSGEESQDVTDGDIQLRFGLGNWPGMTVCKILDEDVFAVCSPLYLGARRVPLSLAEIQTERLLLLNEDETRWHTWRTWFAALGMPFQAKPSGPQFDSFILMTNATLAGHGIGLCWSGLLDTFLESGALVRVSEQSVGSDRGYYVTCPKSTDPTSPVWMVADWLNRAQ